MHLVKFDSAISLTAEVGLSSDDEPVISVPSLAPAETSAGTDGYRCSLY